MQLCQISIADLFLVNDEKRTIDPAACAGQEGYEERFFSEEIRSLDDPESSRARAVRENRVVQIEDLQKYERVQLLSEGLQDDYRKLDMRTVALVPVSSGGKVVALFGLHRNEVRPFSDDEIDLVQTFGAQAVIAIENARQFRELEARVERELAMGDILSVISRSRTDDQPVFELIVDRAAALCSAQAARLLILDDTCNLVRLKASWGTDLSALGLGDTFEMDDGQVSRAICEGRTLAVEDLSADEEYLLDDEVHEKLVHQGRVRSRIVVPLLSETRALGAIALSRHEVRAFTDDEIALVQTFAAQAVVAIENVRQFRELQTRLEREAATREILSVISKSRDDEKPVFDVILENAARLCKSSMARLHLLDDDGQHRRLVAHWGDDLRTLTVGEKMLMGERHPISLSILEGRVIHIEDIAETELYKGNDPLFRRLVEEEGLRTLLTVPLLKDGKGFGCVALSRRERMPFDPEDIELVKTFAAQAVIAIENVRQFRQLQTRLEREAATREILEVISRSRDDEQPVLQTIVESAASLCNSPDVGLHLVDEARTHSRLVCVSKGDQGVFEVGQEFSLEGPHQTPTCIREGRSIHNPDIKDDPLYRAGDPVRVKLVDEDGVRSRLSVPLLRDGVAFGCINVNRHELRPFTPDEIALIETFAAQAVIAIENVHQFLELQTRLEREAATGEILSVISRSRDDELPVFETILRNAALLCDAPMALLGLMNDARSNMDIVAHFGAKSDYFDFLRENPPINDPDRFLFARAIRDRVPFHVEDVGDPTHQGADLEHRVEAVQNEEMRTILFVPLVADDVSIGCLMVYRRVVEPFADDQIALLQTFAQQAVIAIENVRQFRELQTRLEREAASREILQVISQSRDDEKPVFEAILENAARLCNAPIAFLSLANADRTQVVIPAHRGTRSEFGSILDDFVEPITRTELVAVRPTANGLVVREDDIKDDATYRNGDPRRRQMVDVEGARSVLGVPLIRAGVPVGAIILYRREVQPFTTDDVSLIENFAAQAVIAIENVRQFRELQTRLEREAASAQILQVISESRDDENPVFDAILENAARLCNAPMAMMSVVNQERTEVLVPAYRGARPDFARILETATYPIDRPDYIAVRAVVDPQVYRLDDLKDTELYRSGDPRRVEMVDVEGIRSLLMVPLFKDGQGIGGIALYRREVDPFSDDDVTLVEAFAAQAVIAIENVRQFREVQTRLEREAATREILEVISRSRDDEAPVFDAILENACRLCSAPLAYLSMTNDERTYVISPARRGAFESFGKTLDKLRVPLAESRLALARAINECRVFREDDISDHELYTSGDPNRVSMVDDEGARSLLVVPLIQQGIGIGSITLYRREVAPFSDDDVVLVEAFAAQAVIAIENVRQFRALEARTEEVQALNASLEARVEDQVGEIERMGRLKRFLPAAVADTVVSQGSDKLLGSHRALLGVLFCDIRGFTAFCEIAEPEETIEVLQTYHEEMGRLIAEHGAGVDHRIGDGIMVLFNDPLPCDDPAGDAVRLALAMREQMMVLCKRWKKLGHKLGFSVGISMGYATVGMVGYEGRYEYTASGTAVNVGARLCESAADGEILLSQRAATAVEDDYPTEPAGELDLKGIREPVVVFRLADASA